jgi:putative glutamine amidotransferase
MRIFPPDSIKAPTAQICFLSFTSLQNALESAKMPHRPLIGIAPQIVQAKSQREIVGTYRTYVGAIQQAGGATIILAPSFDQIPKYLKIVDGLLLTGGDDIHPRYFGQRLKNRKVTLSPNERTEFELAISSVFLKEKRPILGICLGCQTLNVLCGGTLIQDLTSEIPKSEDHRKGEHFIRLLSGTNLRKIVGKERIRVNSRHHQALAKLGRGLVVSAESPDHVVEAIEVARHPFAIGLQWHPEELDRRSETQKIFSAFIDACKSR